MIAGISKITRSVVHLFYPQLCEACNKPLLQQENILCIGCEDQLSFNRHHSVENNETMLRLAGRFPFRQAISLAYFNEESIMQHLLHRLKYKERQSIGLFLGKKLGAAIRPLAWTLDAVVPVPLHKKKQAKRGFNQSELIAEGISEVLEIPVLEQVIERIKNTATQTDKSRQERIDNVKDAFKLKDEKSLFDKHVLLIDDVLTTGATIEACANELLKIRGVKVSVATVGIAV